MIQRCRTMLKLSAGTKPALKSGSGATTQASMFPSSIESVTRRPMSRPAPSESTPISVPSRSASACAERKLKLMVSGIQLNDCRASVAKAETPPPIPSAATRGPACLSPSSRTSRVSPAAVPSAKVRFS
jgi:hypothetical protein